MSNMQFLSISLNKILARSIIPCSHIAASKGT
uniref:Uncharacterized protein n=1 Tax=Arundo donax TaxID=35708 RepID=A0A0A9G2E1_ARUDO